MSIDSSTNTPESTSDSRGNFIPQSVPAKPADSHAPNQVRYRESLRRYVYRGPRPLARGWFHYAASYIAAILGTVLSTYSAMTIAWWQTIGVILYALGALALFGVSAAYHRGRWKTPAAVAWWRRADHATIALFIAATYTPLCLICFEPLPAALMLTGAWLGALMGAILNLVWINHPRWLDVTVYLFLGWLIVPLIPQLWSSAGSTVVWLLFAGGLVYSIGAVVYGLKWPGRNAKFYGFHEHFHGATLIAAGLHHIAIWFVVVGAA